MKNLEPQIYRKRLTIEAKYTGDILAGNITSFLIDFAKFLEMTPLSEPFIFSPNNTDHSIHHGVAGFMAWVESGCSIYTWKKFSFLTVEVYTCKQFDTDKAVDFVKEYFKCIEIVAGDLPYDK